MWPAAVPTTRAAAAPSAHDATALTLRAGVSTAGRNTATSAAPPEHDRATIDTGWAARGSCSRSCGSELHSGSRSGPIRALTSPAWSGMLSVGCATTIDAHCGRASTRRTASSGTLSPRPARSTAATLKRKSPVPATARKTLSPPVTSTRILAHRRPESAARGGLPMRGCGSESCSRLTLHFPPSSSGQCSTSAVRATHPGGARTTKRGRWNQLDPKRPPTTIGAGGGAATDAPPLPDAPRIAAGASLSGSPPESASARASQTESASHPHPASVDSPSPRRTFRSRRTRCNAAQKGTCATAASPMTRVAVMSSTSAVSRPKGSK
eukprot:Hpha_TRINITY_DN4461_c0_g1::TRINITY_DN4461_c0_g1_i1::g.50430::m.50430